MPHSITSGYLCRMILLLLAQLCMHDKVFTLVETRAISELRGRLVPLNMLELSSISFTGAAFVDRPFNLYFMFVFLMLSSDIHVYSNKKDTSDFHGTVSFDSVKMLQQKVSQNVYQTSDTQNLVII